MFKLSILNFNCEALRGFPRTTLRRNCHLEEGSRSPLIDTVVLCIRYCKVCMTVMFLALPESHRLDLFNAQHGRIWHSPNTCTGGAYASGILETPIKQLPLNQFEGFCPGA